MKEKAPHFVNSKGFAPDSEYKKWINQLKIRFHQCQIKAAVRTNSSLLEFYWNLGHDIVIMKAEAVWGSSFFSQLSLDLRDSFPQMKGFSVTNLKYIKRWYLYYCQEDAIRQQIVDELSMPEKFAFVPWGHHIEIITHCKEKNEALFYIDKTIEGNWSRRQLEDEITSRLYERQGKAITNFDIQLPSTQGALAQEILKETYKFDFLHLRKGYDERDLEEALAHNISRFLLELGKGFAFVGKQMELRMPGGQSFFPDMVFYHTKLKCYVILELKVVPFIPEFAGKLNFYVTAADQLLRDEHDNPSIGLLICKSKDDIVVRWSFQDIKKPIGVAEYELQQLTEKLPTIEEIEKQIEYM